MWLHNPYRSSRSLYLKQQQQQQKEQLIKPAMGEFGKQHKNSVRTSSQKVQSNLFFPLMMLSITHLFTASHTEYLSVTDRKKGESLSYSQVLP